MQRRKTAMELAPSTIQYIPARRGERLAACLDHDGAHAQAVVAEFEVAHAVTVTFHVLGTLLRVLAGAVRAQGPSTVSRQPGFQFGAWRVGPRLDVEWVVSEQVPGHLPQALIDRCGTAIRNPSALDQAYLKIVKRTPPDLVR